MKDIRGVSFDDLQAFIKEKNESSFRAKQIVEWLEKKNADSFDAMSNIPLSLREELKKSFTLCKLQIASQQESTDHSVKYALKLYDNHLIEMVLIPSQKRVTVCVSLQVGCALGCKFCATASMGFVRNLTWYEIYEQVFLANVLAQEKYGNKLSNIVFMGMGEPLLNFDNVCEAIAKITSDKGMAMSPSRITLSTAGISEGIRQLADKHLGIQLAVSLHSADDMVRKQMMPVANKYPLPDLSKALYYYHNQTKQRITLEYLLLANVNDTLEDAGKLAWFCRPFPVKINIIEFNPNPLSPFRASSKERLEEFIAFLEARNMLVQLRRSRGKDIDAACGQLVTKNNGR
jgi:23S rRNA (adenine2503-C2)-methyltransferase